MHPEKEYLEHLAGGRFLLQRRRGASHETGGAGGWVFPPRMAQPGTGAPELDWMEPSGLGTVYATTVVRQKPPATDYNIALVDLAEGVRMMARVDGLAPQDVTIGLAVKARVVRENDQPLVVFFPVEGASS